jgi:hypothetical protein
MKKNSWSNLSPEQRQQRAAATSQRGKERWLQMSAEERLASIATLRASLPGKKKKPRCECGVMTLDHARRLAAKRKTNRTHKEGCPFYQPVSERREFHRAQALAQWAKKTPEEKKAWTVKAHAHRQPRCGCGAMTLKKALRLAATQRFCKRHKPECPFYRPYRPPRGPNNKPRAPRKPPTSAPTPALEQPSPDSTVLEWLSERRRFNAAC